MDGFGTPLGDTVYISSILGIVPSNAGGFGDIKFATEVFYHNEIAPLQSRLLRFNEWAGDEVIKFKPYKMSKAA